MAHVSHIAPLDLRPTGHLPAVVADAVAQTSERADRLAAEASADRYIARNHPRVAALLDDGAREHTEPEVDFAKVAAALPAAVDAAMRKALRDQYSPQTAALIAAGMIGHLAAPKAPLTPEQSTLTLDEGLGAWTTEPVETELLDFSVDQAPEILVTPPWLAARVVSYDSQERGRRTVVWLSYGESTGELTATEAREALAAMREFLPRLEAVVELAEEAEAGA